MNTLLTLDYESVNRAFSKQSLHYDADDDANPILKEWRQQVYNHVDYFLKPNSYILELNAGTGIDAVRFVNQGHRVLATDLSDGMVETIRKKIKDQSLLGKLNCQQCSFEDLDQLNDTGFDFIFSNFGGLNCTDDLTKVTQHFSSIIKPGGFVTLVIMPPVYLWEWLWIFKGYGRNAFRRLNPNGVAAHLEGEFFNTYYYSASDVVKAMGKNFKLIKLEGLGCISPPPSKFELVQTHPTMYRSLRNVDSLLRHTFPFNRWADHIIATFQIKP